VTLALQVFEEAARLQEEAEVKALNLSVSFHDYIVSTHSVCQAESVSSEDPVMQDAGINCLCACTTFFV
jgi:hypothetical protein